MTVLYVTEQGAEVGLQRARLQVRKGRALLDALRVDELEQVVLCGNVQITTQAARALLRQGVDTAFLTRGGAFLGRLSGPTGRNVSLRRIQYRRLDDPSFVVELARRIVAGKLANQRALLMRFQRERRDPRIARALVGIRLGAEKLPTALDLDEMRGIEGKGARDYFSAFPALLTAPGVTFTARLRRPPPDPVNILLSFGYTLLGNVVQGFAELAGLDPHLGALHAPEYGRPSLALDLIEEMRSVVVDVAVLRAFNTRALTPRDFVPVEGEDAPVEEEWERAEAEDDGDAAEPARKLLLTPDGARKWLLAFERRLAEQAYYPRQARRMTYRQILREQVYALSRHLLGEEAYRPFEHRA